MIAYNKNEKTKQEKVIVFNNSGHGHFDLGAYEAYQNQKLINFEYPEDLVKNAIADLPKI